MSEHSILGFVAEFPARSAGGLSRDPRRRAPFTTLARRRREAAALLVLAATAALVIILTGSGGSARRTAFSRAESGIAIADRIPDPEPAARWWSRAPATLGLAEQPSHATEASR